MMNYEYMPVIRMEIEGLKRMVVNALGAQGSELGSCVEAEIEKALVAYPFEEEVKRIVHESVTAAIERHFKYGEGAQSIDAAIAAMFSAEK